MPIVQTFMQVRESGGRADDLLKRLQAELWGEASVGVEDDAIPVIFSINRPPERQHARVREMLDRLDPDWEDVLAVTGPG